LYVPTVAIDVGPVAVFAELDPVSVPSELMVKMLTVPEPLLTAYRYLPSLEAASEAGPLPVLKLPVMGVSTPLR
jgi:hypothetical protein